MEPTFPNAMRSILLVSLLLAGVVSSVTATGSYAPPLTNVEIVVPFPSTTYGGSVDTAEYRVTFSESVALVLQVKIDHPLLEECGEWRAGCCIDGTPVEINEVSPGVFQSAPRNVTAGAHKIEVDLISLPNVYPDCYDFDVTFRHLPCTPTPTPTPTPGGGGGGGGGGSVSFGGGGGYAARPTPTPTVDDGTSGDSTPTPLESPTLTLTPTPTPLGTDVETDGGNLGVIVVIGIGSIIIILLLVAWRLKLIPFW